MTDLNFDIKAPLKVGDYLHASWGYNQTNATFFRVIKHTAKMATVVEVEGRLAYNDDGKAIGLVPSDTQRWDHFWQNCPWRGDPWQDHPFTGRDLDADNIEARNQLECWSPITYTRKIHLGGDGIAYLTIEDFMLASKADPHKPRYDTIALGFPGH
ncbi:MAG: hypothetical protein GY906_35620 [bacterium]|nr:hypothetical protein [bacterium]